MKFVYLIAVIILPNKQLTIQIKTINIFKDIQNGRNIKKLIYKLIKYFEI